MTTTPTTHTPGPWRVGTALGGIAVLSTETPRPQAVALVENEADARLIAAAPALLALLHDRPPVSLSGKQYDDFCDWQARVDTLLAQIGG